MAGVHDAEDVTGNRRAQRAPGRDHSGIWLRNAAAGLCLLAAAVAVVSFTAQYRLVYATRRLAVVAGLEAAIPDAAPLLFACLGIALALHGRRGTGPGLEPRRGRHQRVHERDRGRARLAEPGGLGDAAGCLRAGQRHAHRRRPGGGTRPPPGPRRGHDPEERTPLAVAGGLVLWLLRLALAPVSTLAGFRAWVVGECPVAPGRRQTPSPGRPARRTGPGTGGRPRRPAS